MDEPWPWLCSSWALPVVWGPRRQRWSRAPSTRCTGLLMHETSFAFTRRIGAALEPWDGAVPSDWRQGLPRLEGRLVTLRELEPGDGRHLLAVLATPEVMRFLSPPPQSLERFTGFIETTRSERHAGRYAGFAVVPRGLDHPVGVV